MALNDHRLTVESLELEQVRIDLLVVLDDLIADAALVDALTDTRQRRLGILTPAAEKIQNQQSRDERRDRRRAQRLGHPTGTGHTRTPGNFAGIATAAEIWFTLQHQIRRCSKHLESRRVCSFARLPTGDIKVHDLARVLAHHVMAVTDQAVLDDALSDLVHLAEEIQTFVDAVESATPVNADCPHCGRRTLVARFSTSGAEDLIRCERDPHTRHYAKCTCSDPLCECKQRPIAFRHEWHRPRPGGPVPSWYALRDRLSLTRITKESPTMPKTTRGGA